MQRRLLRSEKERMIAGVCGGLAEYTGVDPVLIRLVFVLLAFASGIGLIAYIVMWLITPKSSRAAMEPRETVKENVGEVGERVKEMGEELKEVLKGSTSEEKRPVGGELPITSRGSFWLALIFIIIGVLLLLGNLGFNSWLTWGRIWPIILIGIGLYLIFRRRS